MWNRLVLHLCALWKLNGIVLIYLSIGCLCKWNKRFCQPLDREQLHSGKTPRNPIGCMTMCLWESESRQVHLIFNLRLASLILAMISLLQFWSSRALTGSVCTSTVFTENHSVLGVMSRREYHFSHMEMMVAKDMVLVLLIAAAIRII